MYVRQLAQYEAVQSEVADVQGRLQQMEAAAAQPQQSLTAAGDADELDAFMTRLSQGAGSDRQQRRQLRARLTRLGSEQARLCRLVNLARPAQLPPLKPPPSAAAADVRSPLTGFIGRRRGGKAAPAQARAAAADTDHQPRAYTAERQPPTEPAAARLTPEQNTDGGRHRVQTGTDQQRTDTSEGRPPTEPAAARLTPDPDTDGGRHRVQADPSQETGSERGRCAASDDGPAPTVAAAEAGGGPRSDSAAAAPTAPPERCRQDAQTSRRKRRSKDARPPTGKVSNQGRGRVNRPSENPANFACFGIHW